MTIVNTQRSQSWISVSYDSNMIGHHSPRDKWGPWLIKGSPLLPILKRRSREGPQRNPLTFFLHAVIPTPSLRQERAPPPTHSFCHEPSRGEELMQCPTDSLFLSWAKRTPESPDEKEAPLYTLQLSAALRQKKKPPVWSERRTLPKTESSRSRYRPHSLTDRQAVKVLGTWGLSGTLPQTRRRQTLEPNESSPVECSLLTLIPFTGSRHFCEESTVCKVMTCNRKVMIRVPVEESTRWSHFIRAEQKKVDKEDTRHKLRPQCNNDSLANLF